MLENKQIYFLKSLLTTIVRISSPYTFDSFRVGYWNILKAFYINFYILEIFS